MYVTALVWATVTSSQKLTAGKWACLEPLEYWEEFSASSVTLEYNA